MGVRQFEWDAPDKLLFWCSVVGAAAPLLVMWWFEARAIEPHIFLWMFAFAAVIVAAVLTAYAVRRSRLGLCFAPLAVLSTCTAGTGVSGDIGNRKVLAFCQQMLRDPARVGADADKLASLAATQVECRIDDLTWGTWEMGFYSADERIGTVELHPRENGGFVASGVTTGWRARKQLD